MPQNCAVCMSTVCKTLRRCWDLLEDFEHVLVLAEKPSGRVMSETFTEPYTLGICQKLSLNFTD